MSKLQPRPSEHFTVAEHLAWLDAYPAARAELIDGQIVMMSGATARHSAIVLNIGAALHGPMRRRGCQTFVSDMIVRRADADSFAALPDVVVRCGPLSDDSVRALSDPVVIFEVLSQGAEREDRTRKFMNYQAISSLQAYVLVRQDEARAEVWLREGGSLQPGSTASGLESLVTLDALEISLPLSVIYEGVDV